MPVTNYLWDEDNIALETDEADATIAEYTYEPEQYGDLISERRGGQTYQHHYDALGSTRMLTDESGRITDTFEFDAFGNKITRTGTTETPFRWVGERGYYFDGENADYHVRARTYNPAISRWFSRDPLSMSNLRSHILRLGLAHLILKAYVYSANNPANFNDPSGLVPFDEQPVEAPVPAPVPDPCCGSKDKCCDCKEHRKAAFKKYGNQYKSKKTGNTCHLRIDCNRSKRGCGGSGVTKCGQINIKTAFKKDLVIEICLSCNCKGLGTILPHELQHFFDLCDGLRNVTCGDCTIFEGKGAEAGCRAAGKTEPDLKRCIECTVNISCAGKPVVVPPPVPGEPPMPCKPYPNVDKDDPCTCEDIGLPMGCGIK